MIISITHELDLDGLGSQAIIYRFSKLKKKQNSNQIKFYYAHYTNFMDRVKKALSEIPSDGQIIISDIGFNDEFVELFPLFEEVKKKDCKILWFDHHIIDRKIEEKMKKIIEVYLNDPKRCSAEIVKDYFLPDDLIAIKIADLSRDIDFHTKIYDSAEKLQSIIAFNRGELLNDNKEKVVKLLSEGIFDDGWYNKQLEKIKIWEEDQSKVVLKNKKVIEVEGFGNIIVSFAETGGSKIVSLLKDHYPDIKVYLGIDIRYNEIIIHSEYINCREFARNYKGGGHKNRAGLKIEGIFSNKNQIKNEFLQSIKANIIKYKLN
ncbi:MAG: DHH family phosphoesterase [Promethearchaeota archaeon]